MFVVHDDELLEMEEEPVTEGPLEGDENSGKLVECQLNMIVGISTPGTIKVKGSILGRAVVVLIDCGATHNFISLTLADELQLPKTETISYGVIMGSGIAVKGNGICRGVVLSLPELSVKEDFLLLDLGTLDVVLGMQWLQTMGKMETDWPALSLKFDR